MLCEALALAVLTRHRHRSPCTGSWCWPRFYGILTAFEVPIRQAFLVEMVGREDLMNAIALNSSVFNLTRIVGPAIAGGLIATVGHRRLLLRQRRQLPGGDHRAAGVMRPPSPGALAGSPTCADVPRRGSVRLGTAEPRALLGATATLQHLRASPVLRDAAGLRRTCSPGARGYGGLMSAVGIGAGVGALAMAAIGHRIDRAAAVITAVATAFRAVLALSASLRFLVRRWWRSPCAGCAMHAQRHQHQHAAPDRGARPPARPGDGVLLAHGAGLAPFGSLQAGWVSEHFGVPVSFVVGAVVCSLVAVGLAWDRSRSARRRARSHGSGTAHGSSASTEPTARG